jgi:(4-alkanoyl-5-oxo-2,5-dihydrofuran-3-yl)methyl phosphate reductase
MILVTGATGTVGRELIRQLLEGKHQVRVLVRDEHRLGDLAARVQVSVGNLDDPASLRPALSGISGVFLLTSRTQQDADVLAAAKDAGARHIVKLSTQEAGWVPSRGMGSGIASARNSSRRPEGYELTGGQLIGAADMAAMLSGVLGQPVSYVDIPEDAARQQLRQAGLPDYVTDGLLETYRLIRAGRFAYTTDTVQHVTGQPPRTFRQWCEQHRNAFG